MIGGQIKAAMDLAVGFNTSGLSQWATGPTPFNPNNQDQILDGLYFDDQIVNGVDLPEVELGLGLSITGVFNAGLIQAGVGGDILGEIFLNLHDFNNDGRITWTEIGDGLAANPFSLYDTSGQITAGAHLSITNFTGWGNIRLDSQRLVLGDFSFDDVETATSPGVVPNPPPPPGLGDPIGGGVVRANIGANAGARDITNKTDGAETLTISASSGNVRLAGFGTSQTFVGGTAVIANGGLLNDVIVVSDTTDVPDHAERRRGRRLPRGRGRD